MELNDHEGKDEAEADDAWLPRASFAPANAYAAPATGTERRLLGLWMRVLRVGGLGVEDDFFEFGGDSFAATALFVEIEQSFGESPPLSAMLDCPTVRLLAARLDRPEAAAPGRPVIPIRPRGTRPPLFVMHAIRGHVLFVAKLAAYLDIDLPVYAIQARGIEPGESPHREFEAMAADYAGAIRRVQPKGPYRLAGYCVGSFIAMEVAQHLRVLGEAVEIVVMVDPDVHPDVAPWLYWRRPNSLPIRAWRIVLRVAWALRRKVQRTLGLEKRYPQPRFTAAELDRQKLIRAGIMAALKTYRPRPYAGRLVIVCAADRKARLADTSHGWPTFAPETQVFAIGRYHHDVFFDLLPALGREIQTQLDRIDKEQNLAAA